MGSGKQTAPTFIKSKKICTSHMILGGFALVMRLVEFNFLPLFSVSRVAKSFIELQKKPLFVR